LSVLLLLLISDETDMDEDDEDEDEDEEEEEEEEDEQIDFVLGGVRARLLFGESELLEVDSEEWSLLLCGEAAAEDEVGESGVEWWARKGCGRAGGGRGAWPYRWRGGWAPLGQRGAMRWLPAADWAAAKAAAAA
jgi:hypothetical protein